MSSTSSQNTSLFPSATNTSPPNNQGPPQSSALYLFTFLATLLLLLAVSCAIVIRSFILRRRFRRRIEEAIAAGLLLPGALDDPGSGIGRRRRDFGEKPKLWEVWVDEHEHTHGYAQEGDSLRNSFGKGEGNWDEILPVSATVLSSNTPKPIPLPGTDINAPVPTWEQRSRHLIFHSLLGRGTPRQQLPTSTPSPMQSPPSHQDGFDPQLTTSPPSINMKDRDPEEEKLQVSVLISMPHPNSRRTHGSDAGGPASVKGKEKGPGVENGETEGEIPDVVIGVAEVAFRQ